VILIKFVKIAMLHVDLPFGLADDVQECVIKGIFLFCGVSILFWF
jgi:hypothetical protein